MPRIVAIPAGSTPPWVAGVVAPQYPRLTSDIDVDVAVIGGGITGLTGAYLCARAGKSVVVLERDAIGNAESGRTTGFLTAVLDARLVDLVAVHGPERARAAWESSNRGIELVETIARENSIDCEFRRLDAYVYGPRAKDLELLKREERSAREFGFAVDLVDASHVPFPCRTALRVPAQARLHPRKYLIGLAQAIVRRGGRIFEGTGATHLAEPSKRGDPVLVRTQSRDTTVRAGAVLQANSAPFADRGRMFERVYACRSYAVAARVRPGSIAEGLYWNTLNPYDYARLDPGAPGDLLILGGADHGVGEPGRPEKAQAKVLAYWKRVVGDPPLTPVDWSGQILNSEDGLPFIGPNPGSQSGEVIASGFGGNGLTLGSLSGWMFSERVLGRATEWDEMYDPARKSVSTAGTGLADPPHHASKEKTRTVRSLGQLSSEEGAWYVQRGRRLGVYRDADRRVWATDPHCTHLGCFVEWNRLEKSWDCPCHGSRFDVGGRVLDGPAARPLPVVELSAPEGPVVAAGAKRARRRTPK
jgi:glycine/D-amino acid oxidase-like deaminating enzyme/nitrite reductase/ring-hydroxylating ferredoxin subunit